MTDDDDIQEYESSGWRKRQIGYDPNNIRNATLEEVAQEFDKMKNGGDTTASFAVFVREMKHERFC